MKKSKQRFVNAINIRHFLGFAFAFTTVNPAQAGLIIQDTGTGINQIRVFSIGQVFTAEDALIQSIGFFIKDFNRTSAPRDHNLQVNLYSGDSGSSGAFIGQSNCERDPGWSKRVHRFQFQYGLSQCGTKV